jgi:chromosome segregation ATPase
MTMNRREALVTYSDLRKAISKLVTRAEFHEVVKRLDGRITELGSEVAVLSARTDAQLRRIDERVSRLDERLARIDEHLARIDESIFKIGQSVARIEERSLQPASKDYGPNLMLAALITIIGLLCWLLEPVFVNTLRTAMG